MIEYIRYLIPTDEGDAFATAYRRAGEVLARSPHHVRHEVSQCVEEPERWMVRIEWDSLDGHMTGFRNSVEFREFFPLIRPYVDRIEEMQHYTVL